MLSRKEVIKIAKLARLELTESEVKEYQTKLGRVLDYFRELDALELPKGEVTKHVPHDVVAFREDRAIAFGDVGLLMDNAITDESNQYLLPSIMENE